MPPALSQSFSVTGNQPVARPFLKWAGGKSQLLSRFQEFYPQALKEKKIKRYYEPFAGSGAVFFDVATRYKIKEAYLYDINEDLVLTYLVIRDQVEALISKLQKTEKKYRSLSIEKRKEFFLTRRDIYNRETLRYDRYSEKWITRAATLIFLNRTCFNGLYRVNSSGQFNSPPGHYKNPKICDANNLQAASKALSVAEIRKADFREAIKEVKGKNAFVYFDPPYRPLSKTANFNSYAKSVFTDREQKELAALFRKLDQKGALLMLSNSDPRNTDAKDDFFDKLYHDFHLARIPARRMINSNAKKRGPVNEIVVTNYAPF